MQMNGVHRRRSDVWNYSRLHTPEVDPEEAYNGVLWECRNSSISRALPKPNKPLITVFHFTLWTRLFFKSDVLKSLWKNFGRHANDGEGHHIRKPVYLLSTGHGQTAYCHFIWKTCWKTETSFPSAKTLIRLQQTSWSHTVFNRH